jgi:mannose-6-phosphate isomerase-like protein (cupin superfamily)
MKSICMKKGLRTRRTTSRPVACAAVGASARELQGNELQADDFVLVEWRAAPDTSADRPIAGLHVHHADDEAWYVLEGRLGFRLGDETVSAGPGSAVLAPKGTAHSFWNEGPDEARYLLVMSPRISALVRELHAGTGEDFHEIFRRHSSALL